MRRCVLAIVVVCCLVPVVAFGQMASDNYSITGGNLNSGGSATMISTNYRASTTIGQSSPIGTAEGTTYHVQMGVQYIYNFCCDPVPTYNYLLWTK